MRVIAVDHLVLTVASIEQSVAFYTKVLGMQRLDFANGTRTALRFGPHKINLHEVGKEMPLRAHKATAGSADLCLLVDDIEAVAPHLARCGVPVEVEMSERSGARGTILSIYIRDPDLNLIELSVYKDA